MREARGKGGEMKHGVYGPIAVMTLISLALTGCGSGQGMTRASSQPTTSVSSNLGKVAYELDGSIYVKSLPDGEPRKVAEGTGPRWSASGGWLLFQRDGALWEVREDGSGEQQLPEGTASSAQETGGISPDGTRRAYVEEVKDDSIPFGRYHRLHVADVGGGDDTVLYESRVAGIVLEGWTADSRHVLFWDDTQFSASLMADGTILEAIPASGGDPSPLYGGLTRPGMVSPAPSGAMLAVTEGSGRESWTEKRIALVDVDNGKVTELTPADMASLEPSWSPDGRRIAFVSQSDNKEGLASGKIPELTRDRRIWVMNSDGSAQRPLTGNPAYRDEQPLWSADGSQMLFARLDENMQASLWLMPSDGGDPRQVVDAIGPSGANGYYGGSDTLDDYGAIDWGSLFDWWQPPSSGQATPQPTAEVTETPAGVSIGHTGIAEVDAIIDAFFTRDVDRLAALLRYTMEPCVEQASVGSPPECPAGVGADTPVDVLPVYSCEGSYVWPLQIGEYLSNLVNDDQELYGVYLNRNGKPNDYKVILRTWTVPARPHPVVLSVSDGRLVSIAYGCGQTALDIADSSGPAVLPYVHVTEARHTARRTGIEEVDAVINAVESRDSRVLRHFLEFTPIACTTNPLGLGGPPLCRPGEADGTVVEAFPIGSCEGHYLRPDQMNGLLHSLTIEQLSLYAVYVPKPESWLTGDYVAVFSRPVSGVGVMAEEVFITDGRIVGVGDSCGIGPELTFQDGEFDEVVLPPP